MFAGLTSRSGPQSAEEGLALLASRLIEPSETTVHGLLFVTAMCGMALGAFALGLTNAAVSTGIALLGIGHFFWAKRRLPIGFIGVPLRFGARSPEWSPVLKESSDWGQWRLRPFFGFQPINMQARALDLPVIVIIVGGKADRPVAITIDASMVWAVWHPWRILSHGESIMVTALQELALSVIRDWGAGKTLETVLADKKGLQKLLQREIDKESDVWGIRVSRILIRNILVKSAKVLDSLESITSEKARVNAVEHIVASTKTLADELTIDMKDAVVFSALQRGHPVDVVWTPPGMARMTQAAATHAGMTRRNRGGDNASHE